MYHEKLKVIIESLLKGNVDKYTLMEYILNNFDCEEIYDSNDNVVTDSFFTFLVTDENKQYYMRFRHYNVDIRRFINQDVVGAVGKTAKGCSKVSKMLR